MNKVFGRIVGLVAAAFMATGCQTVDLSANPQQSSFMMASNAEVAPPAGFIAFCLRTPGQCNAPDDQPQTIQLDQHNWDTLQFVNEHVNRTVRYVDDIKHYGRSEFWTIASDGYGDCDDYALTKRKELIDAGFPERALRVAVVRTYNNIGHAVLTVATDHGDFVLDNMSGQILPWNEVRYTWISRQDASNPMGWVSLKTPSWNTAAATATTTTSAQPARLASN